MDYEDFDDEAEEEDMFPDSEIGPNDPSITSMTPPSMPQHISRANTNARRDPLLTATPLDKLPSYGNNSNGENLDAMSTSQATNGATPTPTTEIKQTHQATGYTWTRDEDAPSYGWRNKKAIEDYHRAMDLVVDKDRVIGRKLHFQNSYLSILLTISSQIWRYWRQLTSLKF